MVACIVWVPQPLSLTGAGRVHVEQLAGFVQLD
jgi:hypothetical protein